jgi:hypothetical protein
MPTELQILPWWCSVSKASGTKLQRIFSPEVMSSPTSTPAGTPILTAAGREDGTTAPAVTMAAAIRPRRSCAVIFVNFIPCPLPGRRPAARLVPARRV